MAIMTAKASELLYRWLGMIVRLKNPFHIDAVFTTEGNRLLPLVGCASAHVAPSSVGNKPRSLDSMIWRSLAAVRSSRTRKNGMLPRHQSNEIQHEKSWTL
jgi:hypothetical protein